MFLNRDMQLISITIASKIESQTLKFVIKIIKSNATYIFVQSWLFKDIDVNEIFVTFRLLSLPHTTTRMCPAQ